jgi:glycosyltransferase involved in cell wall biosynthesis
MHAAALVIPAWNEAATIGAVLDEVPAQTVERVYVVVGDSADPTAEAARGHASEVRVVVPRRRGYGAACWAGAQAAVDEGARIVAFLDGDYSDPPADLPRLLEPIRAGQADLMLGCRGQAEALPWHARLGNRLILLSLHVLLKRRFADLPSFKAITAEALERLDMHEMTYGWTVEMLVKAARAGLRVSEVEVAYRARLAGRSKVSGSLRGTLGAAWKLCTCAVGYASWSPAAP